MFVYPRILPARNLCLVLDVVLFGGPSIWAQHMSPHPNHVAALLSRPRFWKTTAEMGFISNTLGFRNSCRSYACISYMYMYIHIYIHIYMYKWGLIDLNSKPSPIYWRLIIFSWPDDTKVSVVKLNLHLFPSDYVVSQDKPEMTSSHFPAPFTKQSPGAPDFKHPTSASLNCISCSSGTERWTEWNC